MFALPFSRQIKQGYIECDKGKDNVFSIRNSKLILLVVSRCLQDETGMAQGHVGVLKVLLSHKWYQNSSI